MRDWLPVVLNRSDAQEPRFSGDEVATCPDGVWERLTACGLVREVENASSVVCDACAHRHVEEVVIIRSPWRRIPRFYIRCPEYGRILVLKKRLQQWEVDFGGLARGLARAMDLAGDMEEVSPGRIWFLGRTTLAVRSRDLFLARGLTWEDAREVLDKSFRLQAARSALVFVSGEVPPVAIWDDDAPPVVPVKAVVRIAGSELWMDRAYLESLFSTGRKKAPPTSVKSFPTAAGTVWKDIRIIVSERELRIAARGKVRQYTFGEAGFEERRRKNSPNRLWRLLKLFAMYGGVLPFRTVKEKERANLKQYVSDLRDRVEELIPNVEGDMIVYDPREKAYNTRFGISSEESLQFPTPHGTTWEDVRIFANGPTGVRICIDTRELFTARSHVNENDATTNLREPAERKGIIERNYDLRILKLADDQDRPNRGGQALLAVLSGKGTIKRRSDDKGMIELCAILSKLMDIGSSAFEFVRSDERWVALFDVVGGD
jgi:hypothetical protein